MLKCVVLGANGKKLTTKRDDDRLIWYYAEVLTKLSYKDLVKRFKTQDITEDDYNNLKFEISRIK